MAVYEEEDDEHGHNLILHGMVHRLEVWRLDDPISDGIVFMMPQYCPNGLNLTQEDIDALYRFLGKYATKE